MFKNIKLHINLQNRHYIVDYNSNKNRTLTKLKSMIIRQPRYSKEEFAQRGDHLYETKIRPLVEAGNHGKIVAIDIETGAFELAEDTMTATDKLYEKYPSAQTINNLRLPWFFRDIGTLGDGREVVFDMYRGTVIWDGQIKVVDVAASETDPLLAMSLLRGYRLQIDAVEGGQVIISSLS